jgi:squalene cyclase
LMVKKNGEWREREKEEGRKKSLAIKREKG